MKKEIEVFLCYAHQDEHLLEELKKQLRVLQRQGLIALWHDRNISPGAEWEREIEKYLNKADIILLLVSPDFMNSDYCYGNELKRAMQRYEQGLVRVLPIILRPVYWQAAPFGKLQALPKDGRPVVSSSWHSLDEAFYHVAEGIRTTIEQLLASPQPTSVKKERQNKQQGQRAFGLSPTLSTAHRERPMTPPSTPSFSRSSLTPPLQAIQTLLHKRKGRISIAVILCLLLVLMGVSIRTFVSPSASTSQSSHQSPPTQSADHPPSPTVIPTASPTPEFVPDGTMTKNVTLTCTNCNNPLKVTITTITFDSSKGRMVWQISVYNSSANSYLYGFQIFSLSPPSGASIDGSIAIAGLSNGISSEQTQQGEVIFSFLPKTGDIYSLQVTYYDTCPGCISDTIFLDPLQMTF